ncbi:hypothetical protein GCM10008090_30520 [Arenicella chitinivorans]|uniref:Uncharacterized protein n=1 Tax=Arenicella chitinivorans TaxID=1329800 RepID=A0A918VQ63_9GAMM|nr:hypothetical protein GCM10008090_30520 [Arenicella chitinivorans]
MMAIKAKQKYLSFTIKHPGEISLLSMEITLKIHQAGCLLMVRIASTLLC